MGTSNSEWDDPLYRETYYKHLESQFDTESGRAATMIMNVLSIDENHGDKNIITGIKYFREKGGVIESDAPTAFLNDDEKDAVTYGGDFRPRLYVMLLAQKWTAGIENKTIFVKNSNSYSWEANHPS